MAINSLPQDVIQSNPFQDFSKVVHHTVLNRNTEEFHCERKSVQGFQTFTGVRIIALHEEKEYVFILI